MKKLVNNKIVDIRNMELFEVAFESMALKKHTISSIKDTFINDTESLDISNDCISIYNRVHKSLPFPLYAIEDNIKYASIATIIKDEISRPIKCWVDNGLYIYVEDDRAIRFIGDTWGVCTVKEIQEDNSNIELYNCDIGYREFEWVVSKIMRGESLKDFYKRFMRDFVEACNNDPFILKWELSRVLEMGEVPNKINLKENCIIDIDSQAELYIDIYSTGTRKSNKKDYIITIGGDFESSGSKNRVVTVYDFDLYEKKVDSGNEFKSASVSKIKSVKLDGFVNLFETIVGKLGNGNNIEDIVYSGIIVGKKLVYQVDGELYICNANKYESKIQIAKGVNLYSHDKDMIYFTKSILCDSGVKRENTYAYSLNDNSIRISSIYFSK